MNNEFFFFFLICVCDLKNDTRRVGKVVKKKSRVIVNIREFNRIIITDFYLLSL